MEPDPKIHAAGSPFAFQGPAEVVAHRGYSARAPENTLSALSAAVDAGADAVEFDLQVTADGVPILFHDDTLDRTTDGKGAVGDHVLADLGGLDAGSWFAPSFAGEPVPTLARALRCLSAARPRIYPELKQAGRPEDVDRIVADVVEAGFLGRTVFISMDWGLLDRIREVAPEAAIGYIVRKPRKIEEALERATGDPRALLDFDRRIPLRDPFAAHRARALGIPMAAWTVDDTAEADRLLELGVSRITTNQVGRMLDWKRGLEADRS